MSSFLLQVSEAQVESRRHVSSVVVGCDASPVSPSTNGPGCERQEVIGNKVVVSFGPGTIEEVLKEAGTFGSVQQGDKNVCWNTSHLVRILFSTVGFSCFGH